MFIVRFMPWVPCRCVPVNFTLGAYISALYMTVSTNGANLPASMPGENPLAQADWLKAKIADGLSYVSTKRSTFRAVATRIRLVVLGLSSLITIVLGIRVAGFDDILRNIAFVLGGLATTIASVDVLFNYRALWVEHEEAKWRLHRLQDRLEFYISGCKDNPEPQRLVEFHDAYQDIWDQLSTRWLKHRRDTVFK